MFGISVILDNELVYDKEFFSKKERGQAENIAKFILKDSKLTKCAVFLLACCNYSVTALASTGDIESTLGRLDSVGFTFLSLIQRVGMWICLIGCLLELLVAVFREGRSKSALFPIFLKWVSIYAGLFLIPALFDLIKGLCS